MAPTTRSQSSQPQHGEDEGQPANAAGPSTTEDLEATIPAVNESNSYQPEGHASRKPNINDDISSDSEPAPPLKFKSGKTLKTWKKGQAHDASYKPSKESDQSDDTDSSQDWDESPLDQPTWKTKSFETPQPPSAQKTSKKKKPKKSEQVHPVTPAAKTIGTTAKAGHKSLMPTIPGFNSVFQPTSEAGPPAAPRPSYGNAPKTLPPGIFKGLPKSLQPTKKKQEEATNDSNSDDDNLIPWMTGRNRKRKMPDIPGFADIFATNKPPSKTVHPYSYFTNTKPLKPQIPRPPTPKPEIPKEIPKPNETETNKENPPQLPDPQFPNAVKLEPGLLKDRDWPPYPGTIYCKRCFYHDCFRAIKLRRHILHILRPLQDGEAFLHFLKEILFNAAMKSSHLSKAFGQNYFYQQIPGDVTALALLGHVVRHAEGKLPIGTSTETHAKINSSLEKICSLLNIPDYRRITMNWFDSRMEIQRKLQEAGYSLPKVETDAVRASREQIIQTLNSLLSNDIDGPPDPSDDQWFELWQRQMEENISTALKVIDHKKFQDKLKPFKIPEPRKLNCSYCVHSGAENKAKANRPYPRDLAADARIPWAEALHSRYPGQYDKNGNANPPPFVMTGALAHAIKPITNSQEFLDRLRAEGAQEVDQGGIRFLVWKGGSGDGSAGGSSDSHVRFVLVKMWSLVEAIESLDFVPVEHAKLEKQAEYWTV